MNIPTSSRFTSLFLCVLATVFSQAAAGSPISAIWAGGAGSWSDSTKWINPPGVPLAGYQVLIDNGNVVSSLVTVDVATAALNNLAVDAGDGVLLKQNLTADTVRSFGAVTVNNGAALNAGSGGFVQDQLTAVTTIAAGGQFLDSGSYSQGNGSTVVGGSLTTSLLHITGGSLTVQNGGSVGIGSGGYTQDNGVITAVNAGGQMTMTGAFSQGSGSTTVAGSLSTSLFHVTGGSVLVGGAGILSVGSGGYTQGITGTSTTIDSGGQLIATGGDYSQELGTNTLVDGSLTAQDINNSGLMSGTGLVTGNLVDLGTVSPGDSGIGTMSVTGMYSQTGVLDIEIAGPGSNDLLAVNGAASLGGTVQVDLANGFVPALGSTFLVMTYTSRSGTIAGVTGGTLAPGDFWEPVYAPNGLYLTVATETPVPEPGTMACLLVGLVGFGFHRIRRARA